MTKGTMTSLPLWEQTICWVVGVGSIVYGIYRLHLKSLEQKSSLRYTHEGWEVFGGIRDASDYEWAMLTSHLMWCYLPILVLHIFTSYLLSLLDVPTTVKKVMYVALGAVGTVYMQSWRLLLLYLVTALTFFLVSMLRSVPVVWLLAALTTYLCNSHILVVDVLNATTGEDYFASVYIWASVFLRCTFYSVERVWSLRTHTATSTSATKPSSTEASQVAPSATAEATKVLNGTSLFSNMPPCRTQTCAMRCTRHETCWPSSFLRKPNVKGAKQSLYGWPVLSQVPDFLDCFVYVFYVPLLFNGPPLSFRSFKVQIENPQPVSVCVWVSIALSLLRTCLLLVFNNILLQYVYFEAFGENPALLANADGWTIITTAYLIGQFMANKYMVIYGGMAQVARADGLMLASTPSCISYIYTYSDMWRSFDRGLHCCLKRYIHNPLKQWRVIQSAGARTHLALLVTFSSLGYWHGGRFQHMMWSLLNFVEMCLETVGCFLEGCQPLKKHLISRLSAAGMRRLKAVLVYPLFIIATTSNMFFLAGSPFAYLYLSSICLYWKCFLTFGVVVYCMIQNAKHLEQLGLIKCPVTDHCTL